MSFQTASEPRCTETSGAVELVIEPKEKELGGFTVRRVLPSARRRMVGPFIFFDQMGPAEFPPGQGIQVRPHPHIGLATVTYLFEGEIMHRDSLGYIQPIQAGAVNLMTAGRGIVHSERAGEDYNTSARLHGIQSWMVLPVNEQECDPAFVHYPASQLPQVESNGVTVRVIIGEACGRVSPVAVRAPMLYLDCQIAAGKSVELPDSYQEMAFYVVEGNTRVESTDFSSGVMAVVCPGKRVCLEALEDSRIMVIGGDSMGERHIWWNFVSSSKSRIEQAKTDWKENRFDPVPGDNEFIPLPD